MPPITIRYSLPADAQLGLGFSTLTNSTVNECLELTASVPAMPAVRLQEATFNIYKSTEEFYSAMGFSVGASFESGIYSAGGSAAFFRSESTTSSSAYLYLRKYIEFEPELATAPRLTPAAVELLNANPAQFYASCGDHYIRSISRGALFEAVYRFKGLTRTMQESLSASFSASGGSWSANANFQRALSSATARYEWELKLIQRGGIPTAVTIDSDSLLAQAANFGTAESGFSYASATPISLDTKTYVGVTGFPINRSLPPIRRFRDRIAELESRQREVRTFCNDLKDRLSRPGRLLNGECDSTLAALTAKRDQCNRFLRDNAARANACQQIDVCGPNAACLSSVQDEAIELRFPDIPESCRPFCTSLAGARSASDREGYCTRCVFAARGGNSGGYGAVEGLFPANCRYMRRGARVKVASSFDVSTPSNSSAVAVYLITGDGSDPSVALTQPFCAGVMPTCAYSYHNNANVQHFDFTSGGYASGTPTAGIAAWIRQGECLGSSGCNFASVTYDICDMDSNDCGQPLP